MNRMKQFKTWTLGKKVKASVMVEAILVLVVLIALVVIFKTQLTDLVGDIFDKISKNALRI